MKTLLLFIFLLAQSMFVFAVPETVSPRIESLQGTVTAIIPIDKDGSFSFVRLRLVDGIDTQIIDETHKAIRQRTNFNISGQPRPKKGEALLVLDKNNVAAKVPAIRIGNVITIVGYGVTISEHAKGGRVSYERVTINK